MKLYTKSIFALFIGATILSSCSLDDSPTTSVKADVNNPITDMLTLEAMERGVMQSYRATMYGASSEVEEVMMDGFNASSIYANNFGAAHRTDASFTASDNDIKGIWATAYTAIKNFNIFLKGDSTFMANTTLSDANKLEAKIAAGEARFARASTYMYLARHFGKAYNKATASTDLCVPLILAYNQDELPKRATVQQVYDQIKTDLDAAAANLANVAGATLVTKRTNPSIDAVNALYARYYLDIKDYANAASKAEAVINTGKYTLANSDDLMVAEYTNDNGKEPIMQLPATKTENGSGTNNIYTLTSFNSKFKKINKTGFYVSPYYLPSQKLVGAYEAEDLRLKHWFDNSKYIVDLDGSQFLGNFYIFNKYNGNPELYTTTPNARQHVKPLLIGEMYLIAAEANFYNGKVDVAKLRLNELQTARKATATEATEATIQNEWFRETAGEGLRMSCLKRWGIGYTGRSAQAGAIAGAVLQQTPSVSYVDKSMPATDYHYQWPIPGYEMKINPNLVQNPGYDD